MASITSCRLLQIPNHTCSFLSFFFFLFNFFNTAQSWISFAPRGWYTEHPVHIRTVRLVPSRATTCLVFLFFFINVYCLMPARIYTKPEEQEKGGIQPPLYDVHKTHSHTILYTVPVQEHHADTTNRKSTHTYQWCICNRNHFAAKNRLIILFFPSKVGERNMSSALRTECIYRIKTNYVPEYGVGKHALLCTPAGCGSS